MIRYGTQTKGVVKAAKMAIWVPTFGRLERDEAFLGRSDGTSVDDECVSILGVGCDCIMLTVRARD